MQTNRIDSIFHSVLNRTDFIFNKPKRFIIMQLLFWQKTKQFDRYPIQIPTESTWMSSNLHGSLL